MVEFDMVIGDSSLNLLGKFTAIISSLRLREGVAERVKAFIVHGPEPQMVKGQLMALGAFLAMRKPLVTEKNARIIKRKAVLFMLISL